jgi:uncharacterized protein
MYQRCSQFADIVWSNVTTILLTRPKQIIMKIFRGRPNLLTISCLLLFVLTACQKTSLPTSENKLKVEFGVIDSLFSKNLNEYREFWVSLPPGVSSDQAHKKYPVIYLLDGQAYFTHVAVMLDHLSYNRFSPEVIIVGIPSTSDETRWRDFTPTAKEDRPNSGGADIFERFLEDELFQHIESHYPVTSHRTIVGHSLGGLFVINSLMLHPGAFSNYIALDPSLWWDNKRLSKVYDAQLNNNKLKNKRLFIGLANTGNVTQLNEAKLDTSGRTRTMRAILHFIESARTETEGLTLDWKYYDKYGHEGVTFIGTYDGLLSIFSDFNYDFLKLTDNEVNLTPHEVVQKITSDFKKISEAYGLDVLPPESDINGLGYNFLEKGKVDFAISLFKMNIQNYPTSANVFDSMGDGYLRSSDTLNAIDSYERALKLEQLPATQSKLDKIKLALMH